MRKPRVRGVADIFKIDFPIAVVGMPKYSTGNFDLTFGRSINHVVERAHHVTQ